MPPSTSSFDGSGERIRTAVRWVKASCATTTLPRKRCAREESNLRLRLRSPVLSPLSYGRLCAWAPPAGIEPAPSRSTGGRAVQYTSEAHNAVVLGRRCRRPVWAGGLEPPTSCSQGRRAPNCATPIHIRLCMIRMGGCLSLQPHRGISCGLSARELESNKKRAFRRMRIARVRRLELWPSAPPRSFNHWGEIGPLREEAKGETRGEPPGSRVPARHVDAVLDVARAPAGARHHAPATDRRGAADAPARIR